MLKVILEPVHIIPSELYAHKIRDAYTIMKDVDAKDTPFLALALALHCPLWSDDTHFTQQETSKVYTTKEIVNACDEWK